MGKLKRAYTLVTNIIIGFFIIVILIVGISVLPIPGNYKIYSVTSGSMEPVIKTGSLIVVKPLKKYHVNDIVTMKTPEPRKTLTHRIIGIRVSQGQYEFETKGDANNTKDAQTLLMQNIIGKVFYSIPLLGYPISYSKTLAGLLLLIIIPGTIIIYSEFMNIKNEVLRILAKKRKSKIIEKVTVKKRKK